MNLSKGSRIAVAALVILAPALLSLPASKAGTPTASPLIDREFELALRKHLSKRFFSRIAATDEQKEKLTKIMDDTQDSTRPLREQLRQGVLDLSAMLSDEKTSDEQIRNKVKDLKALHEQVQEKRLSALLELRKVLTADQRQKIHARFTELLSGGLRPRGLSMMMRGNSSDVLSD